MFELSEKVSRLKQTAQSLTKAIDSKASGNRKEYEARLYLGIDKLSYDILCCFEGDGVEYRNKELVIKIPAEEISKNKKPIRLNIVESQLDNFIDAGRNLKKEIVGMGRRAEGYIGNVLSLLIGFNRIMLPWENNLNYCQSCRRSMYHHVHDFPCVYTDKFMENRKGYIFAYV